MSEGDVVTFNATVRNDGAGGTDSGFSVEFKVDGSSLSTEYSGVLGAGNSNSVTSSGWSATEGIRRIQVCADSTGLIPETNESNNCTETDISVQPPPLSQCEDDLDNDGDGWTSSEDPGCWNGGVYDPNDDNEADGLTSFQCSDGEDNDEDGDIDGNDSDCVSSTDDSESSPEWREF
ncbi:MAG TPA: CARDB domain-containing protein [Candidatus Paceibacterota bacterium]|nr:CARDB domain-containing protein [Candidatus Paceibacterota bacterium]